MRKRGLAFIGLCSIAWLSSCGVNPIRITACAPIYTMDTTISIVFYNVEDSSTYYNEIKNIYKRIDLVADGYNTGDKVVSIYDLNHSRECAVNDDLLHLIQFSEEMYEDTNGYFNPYIGRLSCTWKDAIEREVLPSDSLIKEELEIVKNTSLSISDHTVKINGDGYLDLGGIAKGYATQLAVEYLESVGVKYYSIDAGNSSVAVSSKVDEDFSVGLSKPFENGYIGILKGQNLRISTSSPKYQHFEVDGIKYHHILNPFTGYPTNTFDSVNVLGVDLANGDAYSTAIFSMSEEEAKSFIERKNICAILYKGSSILYQSKEIILS